VPNCDQRALELQCEFNRLRSDYCGLLVYDSEFNVELVGNVIADLCFGKAPGPDGLGAEHLVYSHPIVSSILAKLFNLFMCCAFVPIGFGHSYIVPLPKIKDCRTKAMTCDDFRGIAISSILSKVFEHCILNRFDTFLSSDDNQFGFKKGSSCSHAIFTLRNIVEHFVKGGNTVNLCSIDLSKAFDKTNHNALLIKLMKRRIPIKLLDILDFWLKNCWSCVKWNNSYSDFFKIEFGVRQGSVLSPTLFAVYLNDVVAECNSHSIALLYADDILLISPSVCSLQTALNDCERELKWLDMIINAKKSCCLRIGRRFDITCCNITTQCGQIIPWVSELRYLGIVLVSAHRFKCSLEYAKRAYYRCVNAIYGKIGRAASEEVILQLVKSKCIPILMYGIEVCNLIKSELSGLDFVINRFLMKLFRTNNVDIIHECAVQFAFELPSSLVKRRVIKFLDKHAGCNNRICALFAE